MVVAELVVPLDEALAGQTIRVKHRHHANGARKPRQRIFIPFAILVFTRLLALCLEPYAPVHFGLSIALGDERHAERFERGFLVTDSFCRVTI